MASASNRREERLLLASGLHQETNWEAHELTKVRRLTPRREKADKQSSAMLSCFRECCHTSQLMETVGAAGAPTADWLANRKPICCRHNQDEGMHQDEVGRCRLGWLSTIKLISTLTHQKHSCPRIVFFSVFILCVQQRVFFHCLWVWLCSRLCSAVAALNVHAGFISEMGAQRALFLL